jgi:hypothetical protein
MVRLLRYARSQCRHPSRHSHSEQLEHRQLCQAVASTLQVKPSPYLGQEPSETKNASDPPVWGSRWSGIKVFIPVPPVPEVHVSSAPSRAGTRRLGAVRGADTNYWFRGPFAGSATLQRGPHPEPDKVEKTQIYAPSLSLVRPTFGDHRLQTRQQGKDRRLGSGTHIVDVTVLSCLPGRCWTLPCLRGPKQWLKESLSKAHSLPHKKCHGCCEACCSPYGRS